MSVWFCIPSARPPEEAEPVLKKWDAQGYKIALCVDSAEDATAKNLLGNIIISSPDGYRGYARSVNSLIRMVIEHDPQAAWFVTGGDDVLPDPNKSAEEIARECSEHFAEHAHFHLGVPNPMRPDLWKQCSTFGVMQPTGHRYGEDPDNPNPAMRSAYIDRVAGSAWMGREWCRRINQGKGPLWPEFEHMHVDECLREVAVKLGVYWERRDLTHFHNHWGLPREGEKHGYADRMPEHLKKWNTDKHWRESKAILDQLRAEDFKSCLPL